MREHENTSSSLRALVRVPREVMVPLVDRVKRSTVTITYVKALAPTVELKEEVKSEASAPKEENKEGVKEHRGVKKTEFEAGTGFIVHCSDTFTVVVHISFKFQGQKAIVKFWDGTKATDTMLIKLRITMNLIVTHIARGDWQQVEYAQIRNSSQNVLSLVSLVNRLLPFVGKIISPRCICVDEEGKEIPGTSDTFTFNLPFAGQGGLYVHDDHHARVFEALRNYVLGAPVFNLDGRLVGFVRECGISFDFKHGMRSDNLRTVIHEWLDGRRWKDAVKTDIKGVQDSTAVQGSTGVQDSTGSSKRSKQN